ALGREGMRWAPDMALEGVLARMQEVVLFSHLPEGGVGRRGRRLAVSAVELFVGVNHALGRPAETLALRIIAGERKQRADGRFGLLTRGPCRCRRGAADMVGKLRFAPRLDASLHNRRSHPPSPQPRAGGVPRAAASLL